MITRNRKHNDSAVLKLLYLVTSLQLQETIYNGSRNMHNAYMWRTTTMPRIRIKELGSFIGTVTRIWNRRANRAQTERVVGELQFELLKGLAG